MEKVFVFGRGRYYHYKKQAIREAYEIFAFLDNHIGDKPVEEGIPVYAPADLKDLPPYKVLVMTARNTFVDMIRQLMDLKIDSSRILVGMNLSPEFDACERLLHRIHGKVCLAGGDKCKVVLDREAYDFQTTQEFLEIMNRLYKPYDPYIQWLADMPLQPLSRKFGRERGTPIDRYYMEAELEKHRNLVHGDVYEVGEETYTRRFGTGAYRPHAIHVEGIRGMKKVNLATGEGITENMADCFICTQVLQFIYDLQSAAKNIYKMLKPGGSVILTGNGINPLSLGDYRQWGAYWNFTDQSLKRLFVEAGFPEEQVEVHAHGNVKTAICFLYGMCIEDLKESDFLQDDVQFPLLLTVIAKK